MDRILVGIPVLTGAAHCKEAIDSVMYKERSNKNAAIDLLIIDNGSEQEVKDLIYNPHFLVYGTVIKNEVNQYVNPAWNQIIEYGLRNNYDRIIIMNSDLIMNDGWDIVCRNRWEVNQDEILLPVMDELHDVDTAIAPAKKVDSGTPGVFITLNRKQAELIYPIPSEILVWFGDLYLFTILRAKGYETLIPENLLAKHYWSSTISRVPGISEIIEEDKKQWEIVKEKYLLPLVTKQP